MKRTALMVGSATLAAAAVLPAHAADPIIRDFSRVTMSKPSPEVVTYGKSSVVTGKVSGVVDLLSSQKSRNVRLELRTPNGWMPLRSSDLTDAAGRYSVKVPTTWYYRGAVRTSVPASDTHRAAVSSTTETVRVKPPYRPQGKASSWAHLFNDTDARWNPCEVITYKVNATGGPSRAVKQVKQSVRRVSAATGLRFRYEGSTRAIPWRTDGRKPEYSDAALTISWATPKQVDPLSGGTAGWGGGWYVDDVVYRGGIALDRTGTSFIENGFGRGATWGSLLLHEIGHVMGLGHVMESSQIMYPSILPTTVGRFGAGDLAGLGDKGAMGGCTPKPAKRGAGAPQFFATY